MAKIRTGVIAGQIRGSIGSTTFSQNRYGSYIRNRALPTISTTDAAQLAKSRFSSISRAWGLLTDAQRLSWKTWAQTNPVTDVFGESQTLPGNTAYQKLSNQLLAVGSVPISDPPTVAGPTGLLTVTFTADIGAGNFQAAYTPTPLPAGVKLMVWGCVVDSPGRTYIKNLLRLIYVSSAAAASPAALQPSFETRFGALQVGQTAHIWVTTVDTATGLVSVGFPAQGVVVST